jgi:hypothetical protein
LNIMSWSMYSYFNTWWIALQVKLTEEQTPLTVLFIECPTNINLWYHYVYLNKEQRKRLSKHHHSTCLRYIQNYRSKQQVVIETKMVVVLMKVLKMPHKSSETCWNAVTHTPALCFIPAICTLQSLGLHLWWMNV